MSEPVAYLLRSSRNGSIHSKIICGHMFMRRETAQAAADRMTNHWRTVWVVPVVEATGD